MPLPLELLQSVLSDTLDETGEQPESAAEPADFETAISATKFGKFNIFLFLIAIPAGWAPVFETTTMSYVFPAAQCDLELSLQQKGSLNAITFLGMVSTGFVWGFLCDTLGRKKLLVAGYLLDAVFVIMSSFSQNFATLVATKFLGGVIINGPFAALAAYLSEFHSSKYRSKIQLGRGVIVSSGSMVLPLLAWAIFPQNINLKFLNDWIEIHSWNLYLLVCAFPALISGVIFIFMPESPKFLMTVGRNEEALAVFQKIYSVNTGDAKENFPIKQLVDETKQKDVRSEKLVVKITAKRNKIQALQEGLKQIKPLFFQPYIKHLFLVCCIQMMLMSGGNSIRLWLPQIFQAISDYQFLNNGTTSDLCTMLIIKPESTNSSVAECFVNLSPSVYMNTMVIATVSITGYILVGTFVNKLGSKPIMLSASIMSGCCAMSMFFATDIPTTLTLSSFFLALSGLAGNLIITFVIDLFPTHLRTVTISLVMMLGRSASMLGNMVFPMLLEIGCAPPFFTVGAVVAGAALFEIFLPKIDSKALV